MMMFDTNRDGVIDANEIAHASDSLSKLDKNSDGKITPDELRPPRPPQDGPAEQ
jgi:Ca2+-binding EF-hand superfamily protein